MARTTYKISEISKAVGVPQATLRLWEQHGLIHPERTETGYRLFSEGDFSRVREIVRLRSVLGLNLAAIRATLENGAGNTKTTPTTGSEDGPSLGPALRQLRQKRKMTINQLAEAVGVSSSTISTLEKTSRGASIPLLRTISKILGTTITELTSSPPSRTRAYVRAGKGQILPMFSRGIKIQQLATGPRMMDCQEWTLQPGAKSDGFYSHDGEEFIRVLDGCFEIEVDGLGRLKMVKGDSLYFESHRPHSWRCSGDKPCSLLWVNTPPTF